MNRVNIICLGVTDMKRSIKFYRDGLGFKTNEKSDDPAVIFFDNQGTKLELYPVVLLAEDINKSNPPRGKGFSRITLAYNAKNKDEVDIIINKARNAGGKIEKEPEDVFWGGYSGYFSDPDGFYWEVAYSDNWKFDESDMLIID